MKHYTVDVSKRMKAIKNTLDEDNAEESEVLVRKKEALLEELIEIVENIDYARGTLLIKSCVPQGSDRRLCVLPSLMPELCIPMPSSKVSKASLNRRASHQAQFEISRERQRFAGIDWSPPFQHFDNTDMHPCRMQTSQRLVVWRLSWGCWKTPTLRCGRGRLRWRRRACRSTRPCRSGSCAAAHCPSCSSCWTTLTPPVGVAAPSAALNLGCTVLRHCFEVDLVGFQGCRADSQSEDARSSCELEVLTEA